MRPDSMGFAQHFQDVAAELGQFIEKQHTAMRQRHFTRSRLAATTHECRAGGRVVRGPEGSATPLAGIQAPRTNRGDGGRLQRIGFAHGRKNARQAGRQHGLAGAGRTHQQQIVTASRRHLQGPFCAGLATDVGEIVHFAGGVAPGSRGGV